MILKNPPRKQDLKQQIEGESLLFPNHLKYMDKYKSQRMHQGIEEID